jgi:tRNA 2-thiocytidine biosynthesis protein TtcA
MHQEKIEQRILRSMNLANRTFNLIQKNDHILIALSGGKDSYGLLWALQYLQKTTEFKFQITAYHLDQGQPGHDASTIQKFCEEKQVAYEYEYQDTYSRVIEKTKPGKIYCSLCSRFRRAILYKAAKRLNCNKVALGHHRDDIIETLLLNMFFAGQIKAMPAILKAQRENLFLIRPLCYVPEEELIALSNYHRFPVIPCKLCGSQQAQRDFVKKLLQTFSMQSPHIKGNLISSLSNITLSHLLLPGDMKAHSEPDTTEPQNNHAQVNVSPWIKYPQLALHKSCYGT